MKETTGYEIQSVTLKEAADIVVSKRPRGLFYAKAESISEWVAIKNTSIRMETDSFGTEVACLKWLKE